MNHTTPPEATAAQIAEWWDEARDVHADNPGLAPVQLARRAAAWAWAERGVVKESLTTPEESSVVEAPADPIRTALQRLVKLDDAHEGARQWEPWLNAIAAARAALAAAPPDGPAVPEGREPAAVAGEPSDMDCAASNQLSLGVAESFPPGDDEIRDWADSCNSMPPETLVDEGDWEDGYGYIFRPAQFYKTVRAALVRWGRPVPPPAEGEVAELVAWLRSRAAIPASPDFPAVADRLRHAAALLERQAAPVPVPVSERLPEAEDCDAEGFIWLWDCDRRWVRQRRDAASSNTWTGAHWLPGWFLPLPSGRWLMTELSPAAMRVLAATHRSQDDEPTRCKIAADILEALALEDETLFDVEDERVPAVRAVRTGRILAIDAELRGGAA